uniref:Uncharacterized protein n=1 Tax=Moumouvirus sp. 'Monve' TaxID=1128131 RepID=H2EFE8_9VIRU|nr:hypothetical protein mv_R1011 [Moumouvirus Monve]
MSEKNHLPNAWMKYAKNTVFLLSYQKTL